MVNNLLILDVAADAFSFSIQDGGSKYSASEGLDYGCVFAPCEWLVTYRGEPEHRESSRCPHQKDL